jgi:hypothetical protein
MKRSITSIFKKLLVREPKYTTFIFGDGAELKYPHSMDHMGEWVDDHYPKDKDVIFGKRAFTGDEMIPNIDIYDSCELTNYCNDNNTSGKELLDLANHVLVKIKKARKNYVIAYSGLTKNVTTQILPKNASLIFEDIEMLEEIISRLPINSNHNEKKEIDVILNTSGGDVQAVLKILLTLRKRFYKVNVVVPFIAQSAGTILACGADQILSTSISSFSQVTPVFLNNDAHTMKGKRTLEHWISFLLDKEYREIIGISPDKKAKEAETVIARAMKFLLNKYSLKNKKNIKEAMDLLTNFERFYCHLYPIGTDDLLKCGINIEYMDANLEKDTEILQKLLNVASGKLSYSKILMSSNYTTFLNSPIKIERIVRGCMRFNKEDKELNDEEKY